MADNNEKKVAKKSDKPGFFSKAGKFFRDYRSELKKMSEPIDAMGVMKPFSFVLEDDEREPVAELYVADDDTVIIGGELMEDLDQELDAFFEELIRE